MPPIDADIFSYAHFLLRCFAAIALAAFAATLPSMPATPLRQRHYAEMPALRCAAIRHAAAATREMAYDC